MPQPIKVHVEPGKYSSELWITVATLVASIAATAAGVLPPKYAAIANAVSVAIYTICRTFRKNAAPTE